MSATIELTKMDDAFWTAQTSHAATKVVLQQALWMYEGLDVSEDEQDPRDFIECEADDYIACERGAGEGYNPEDGELWPYWCTLVATPAINKTIDWPLIHRLINERRQFLLEHL